MKPYFPYEPESLEAARKYLSSKEVYDEETDKNIMAIEKINRKQLPKTIEWHTLIQYANQLKEQEG